MSKKHICIQPRVCSLKHIQRKREVTAAKVIFKTYSVILFIAVNEKLRVLENNTWFFFKRCIYFGKMCILGQMLIQTDMSRHFSQDTEWQKTQDFLKCFTMQGDDQSAFNAQVYSNKQQ